MEKQDVVTARELKVAKRRERVVNDLGIDPKIVEVFDMYIHKIEGVAGLPDTYHLAIQSGMSLVWIEINEAFEVIDKGDGFYSFRNEKFSDISIRPTGSFTVNL